MENRLYPTWAHLAQPHTPLTPGEQALILYLDANLPRDPNWKIGQELTSYNGWLIFAQPHLNGTKPDVIIFNPQVGLVIYEVKDWDLRNYDWSGGELFVKDAKGSYPIKSPIAQVSHYKEKLIGQLIPLIGEVMDGNHKSFGLVKTALYFHKASTQTAQAKFGIRIKDLKSFPIFGYDMLSPSSIQQIAPDVKITKSWYWQQQWNEDVVFWLNPPYHSIEQGTFLKLKGNQTKVAEPESGHFRVRGVAGSGKTQALAYRAGKLASMGYSVLVVSFNITLWHYVKDMIARAPFSFSWGKISFNHFHGFCKDRLNEFERNWPKSPQRQEFDSKEEFEASLENFFRLVIPSAVVQGIEGKAYQKYDAILIDEGQDYYFEWYSMLTNHFLSQRDEVLIVCDKRQNIFDRELDWLDKRVTKVGLEKLGPYIDLTVTLRLPKRVALLTNEFSELFGLNQDLKVGKIEDLPIAVHSQHVIWLEILESEWLAKVLGTFKRLKKANYSASDMVFLLPSHELGMQAVEMFKSQNIEVNHVFEEHSGSNSRSHKKAFWMGDGRVKMCTIHSFKGWELVNVILYIPPHGPESNKKLDSIIYTALTRTKENLIVLNANPRYAEFGAKLPKKWEEQ
jgi:hypothetical protein